MVNSLRSAMEKATDRIPDDDPELVEKFDQIIEGRLHQYKATEVSPEIRKKIEDGVRRELKERLALKR